MTKKDYVKLAAALAYVKPDEGIQEPGAFKQCELWHRTVNEIANVCAADNGRFDRGRFEAACNK